jgi:hypothetical protein
MNQTRYGHAFPHPNDTVADPIADAGSLLTRATSLGPRAPTDAAVVSRAEDLLGIDPARRPVYAYVGFLHPGLGRVGLIVARGWFAREPHGVARCDTGGLVGRIGGFRHLTQNQADSALAELTHPPTHAWEEAMATEVMEAFGAFRRYISGATPRDGSHGGARRICIDAVVSGGEALDPRLWIWEARSFSNITTDDVEALAIAPEAWKELQGRYGDDLPLDIEYLVGQATPGGLHHFREEQVVAFFEGGAR